MSKILIFPANNVVGLTQVITSLGHTPVYKEINSFSVNSVISEGPPGDDGVLMVLFTVVDSTPDRIASLKALNDLGYVLSVGRTNGTASTAISCLYQLGFSDLSCSLTNGSAYIKDNTILSEELKNNVLIPFSHTISYNNTSGITFRQKPLRKDHLGSMGFSVGSNTNSKIQFLESSDMLNITKKSHTWFIFLQRTVANSQERLFGDNGDGVNKRVCWSAYDFPNNQRKVDLRYLLNQPQFICITYNVEEKAYRLFTNGKWYSQTYIAPPTSTSGGQWMTLPQTAGYSHYGIRGYVSDFTWFNRALTSLEVEKVYQLGKLE